LIDARVLGEVGEGVEFEVDVEVWTAPTPGPSVEGSGQAEAVGDGRRGRFPFGAREAVDLLG